MEVGYFFEHSPNVEDFGFEDQINGAIADVEVVDSEHHRHKCHKLILKSRSGFFRQRLAQAHAGAMNEIRVLHVINNPMMKLVLNIIYGKNQVVNIEDGEDLLKALYYLRVDHWVKFTRVQPVTIEEMSPTRRPPPPRDSDDDSSSGKSGDSGNDGNAPAVPAPAVTKHQTGNGNVLPMR